jgi:hypothetical protein
VLQTPRVLQTAPPARKQQPASVTKCTSALPLTSSVTRARSAAAQHFRQSTGAASSKQKHQRELSENVTSSSRTKRFLFTNSYKKPQKRVPKTLRHIPTTKNCPRVLQIDPRVLQILTRASRKISLPRECYELDREWCKGSEVHFRRFLPARECCERPGECCKGSDAPRVFFPSREC